MGGRFDEVDRRILYELTADARHTSAPDIASEVDVSPPTVRNRIRRLEEAGVIEGYHAHVDYEKLGGRLTNLFLCTATTTERSPVARRLLDVSGVVNVREIMTGMSDLHVIAVGRDTTDITRIAREISAVGVRIDDEELLYREHVVPYEPFGGGESDETRPVTGIADISEDADLVEVTVGDEAPVVGKRLETAVDEGLIHEDVLVVSVDSEDQNEGVTPDGTTVMTGGETVTVFSRTGLAEETLRVFTGG